MNDGGRRRRPIAAPRAPDMGPVEEGDPVRLAALEATYLTSDQRRYLDAEARSEKVRWDLDPPQREEFDSDVDYMRALGAYAERCLVGARSPQGSRVIVTEVVMCYELAQADLLVETSRPGVSVTEVTGVTT